jgi:hypothetical protein
MVVSAAYGTALSGYMTISLGKNFIKKISAINRERNPDTKSISSTGNGHLHLPMKLVNWLFDSKKNLLQCAVFMDESKIKYVSKGIHPAIKISLSCDSREQGNFPITLTTRHMKTITDYLPRFCQAICVNEY